MRFLLSLLGLLLLAGCSQSNDQTQADRRTNAKPAQFHRYLVTFAAVKVPNELLQSYMTNAAGPNSIKERCRIASYLLAHTNDYSIITPAGNFTPVVTTGHETGGRFRLDDKQETADLEKTGIKTTILEMNLNVKDENDQGDVMCGGTCIFDVDTSSTGGNGGTLSITGGMLTVGQADLQPLSVAKKFTLCALVRLNRAD